MSDGLQLLENLATAALARQPLPTPERIREVIDNLRGMPLCADVTSAEAEHLAMILEERHGVTMQIGTVLVGHDYEPWLGAARLNIAPYYWDRYVKLLTEQGRSGQVLATIGEVTERTLGLLENPLKHGPWDRRGMVVGHVQSGKTANYAGLICKAADAGYRLVVVIAGVHNRLRNQTQIRLDEGVVGRDSARLLTNRQEQFVGVGRFDRTRRPFTFTNSVRDFNKTTATGVGVPLQNLTEPALFVIKKNSNTLNNLLEWLKDNARSGGVAIDVPMLVIDDEADNASINTKHGIGEVTKINGQIRDLLHMFDRRCYVGYTATPFANIFIDPDTDHEMLGADLFPKDFIISLDSPTNYFGPDRVFVNESEHFVRHIEDHEEYLPLKHTIDTEVWGLPESLQAAICAFVVARALRLLRGQVNQHSSMLVNASRFTQVQHQLRSEIHQFLEGLKASVRVNGALAPDRALRDPEIGALKAVWEREYAVNTDYSWPQVQRMLHEAAAPIAVVEINSKSAGALNYEDYEKTGLNVIAVGGFSLSRGLTLRGLMVTYFLRNSMMYDTLMQMGRWFGYHDGYDDLCRVWLPEDAEGWYAHIAESIEELREELRGMEAANATPEEFGLKVRAHPDALIVTARGKMGTGELIRVAIGLGNHMVETSILRRDPESLELNRASVERLAKRLADAGRSPRDAVLVAGGRLLRDAPVGPIFNFVTEFRNHPGSMLTDPGPLLRYIDERRGDRFAVWDVLFASLDKRRPKGLANSDLIGITINCQQRSPGKRSNETTLYVTSRQRVASRGIEKAGLSQEQITEAEAEYRADHPDRTTLNYPDLIYRKKRARPLLIIHLLAIGKEDEDLSQSAPVVAWGISFPAPNDEEERVEYVVNTTWLRENYREDLDEDEMAGDDQ
ncbi:MAG: Z1 domain-containing protein [Candidatus Dormibacteria bacterium]